ncbi:MAG: virulence protein E [Proteobacteria bacterium]|nr:virulence protein E [Pseudomonadota bacterium]
MLDKNDDLIIFEGGQIGSDPQGPRSLLEKCRTLTASKPLKWPRASSQGAPHADIANLMYFVKWAGVDVVYDCFARRFMVRGVPGAFELDEEAVRDIRITLEILGLEIAKESFKDWIFYIAQQRKIHPVLMYLNPLKWDGIDRLDTWLTDYCGVADSPYTRAVGRILMIGAVRRVRHPGIKFDTMVVFEGVQGQGKSSVPKLLAGEPWFTDDMKMGLESKEVIEKTAGKWIVEVAELHGLSNREIEAVKSFISRTSETARGAYRANSSTVPRAFVLIGTTNDRKYLKDPTGNRRFLPIFVPGDGSSIDLDGLAAARDQLWAEASEREAAGAEIRLPEELWPVANAEQAARLITDPKTELLMDLLEGEEGFIATDELYSTLGLDPQHREQRHQVLLSSTMNQLGWAQPPDALAIKDDGDVVWRHRGWRKGEGWRERILVIENGRCAALTPDEIRQRCRSKL